MTGWHAAQSRATSFGLAAPGRLFFDEYIEAALPSEMHGRVNALVSRQPVAKTSLAFDTTHFLLCFCRGYELSEMVVGDVGNRPGFTTTDAALSCIEGLLRQAKRLPSASLAGLAWPQICKKA